MSGYIISLQILFIYGILAQISLGLSPVIFVPGDGGAQVEAKLNKTSVVHYICHKTSDFSNIWLNLEELVPGVIDCWVDNMRLEYDNVTRTTRSPDGVVIRFPGWGTSEPVEWLDPSHAQAGAYFNTIADSLVRNVGLKRNVSILGAPYDFRKAPNEHSEFFVNFKTLVEDTYLANNKTPVTLIVHSMGGLMASHFLRLQRQSWKDQYIRRMISLSTPWAGSVKAIKAFAAGDDLGSRMLSGSTMRTQQITCPSLAWLLPSPLFWKSDEVLVQTEKFNYTIKDLQKYFSDIDVPNAWEMRKDVEKYILEVTAPGVEVHCVYGYNISTVERLVYKPRTWLDGNLTLAMGDGDGTVNLRSLTACEHWRKRRVIAKSNAGKMVKVVPLATAEHLTILHDQRVIDYINIVMKQ